MSGQNTTIPFDDRQTIAGRKKTLFRKPNRKELFYLVREYLTGKAK